LSTNIQGVIFPAAPLLVPGKDAQDPSGRRVGCTSAPVGQEL
jgi:hypothetical protein